MAHEIVMPQLGLSMESGRIARWLKQPGEPVQSGEVLLEVESDKATIEVEAVTSGRLAIVVGGDAGDVKVGTVIGYILAVGETAPDGGAAGPAQPAAAAESPKAVTTVEVAAPRPAPAPGMRRLPSSPAARRRARELGVDWEQAQGSGPRGRIKERDVARLAQALAATAQAQAAAPALSVTAPAPSETGPRISPLARGLAEALGLDPELLARRYPGQRIEREDVELAARELLAGRTAAGAAPARPAAVRRAAQRKPMGSLRRLIAERMSQSAHTNAAVTLTTEVDATELVRLRETLKAAPAGGSDPSGRAVPSYNVLLARLVALALQEHPDLNASIEDGAVVHWATVNVGIAVDSPRGLVVPVLHDVPGRSLADLASQAEELLGRAREGQARPDELTNGTFTITNLGSYGIDAFTPIINPPECAVLGVGRLRRQPVVLADGSIAARTVLALSLTFDHRLVDGGPAARFLQRVGQFVEQPYLWLTRTGVC
jgi:pyruvate dehydrogenase E2 component (dihydrolipoamide acetyltransferase)